MNIYMLELVSCKYVKNIRNKLNLSLNITSFRNYQKFNLKPFVSEDLLTGTLPELYYLW